MVLRFHSEEDPGAKLLLHHLTIILILIIISGAQPSYVKLCLFLHPESNYPKAWKDMAVGKLERLKKKLHATDYAISVY